MASIRRRKRAKRDVWFVDYRDNAGMRCRITAPTRETAEDLLAEKIRERRQAGPEVTDREVTLAVYAERWLAQIEADIKPRTHASYSETLARYILPEIGRIKVRALHRGLIKDLLARRRAQGLSKNTVRLTRGVLSVLLGDAVDDGIIATNPALQMGRRRRRRADSLSQAERLKKVRPMSSQQVAAFLQATQRPEDRRFYPLFLVLARAGLRPGEAFGLQWDDVDFVERTLNIERSYSRGSLDTTKTGESRRVDMSQGLTRVLRRHQVDRAAETLRRGWKTPPPWVFCSAVGTPLDLYNVTRVFKRALRAASLPNFRLYDLRHTFATLLLARNAPITYVAAQLGHSKPTTTLQWYAHWLPSGRETFVDALDEADVAPQRVAVPFAAPTVAIENPVLDLTPRPRRARQGTNWAPIQESLMDRVRQVGVNVGSPGRSRTCDILINSQALYRLSYRGTRTVILSYLGETLHRMPPGHAGRGRRSPLQLPAAAAPSPGCHIPTVPAAVGGRARAGGCSSARVRGVLVRPPLHQRPSGRAPDHLGVRRLLQQPLAANL